MADNNALEKLINSFYGVPLPPRLPPAPTKRISDVAWRGDGVDPFSSEGGWWTEAPDSMQPMKICRRRAGLEYLRHGHLDYLDLAVVIGPKSNEKEWLDRRGAMKQEVSIMHGKLAGKQSYLVQTLEAEIMLDNMKVIAHNHYLRGRELEVRPPTRETAQVRNKRILRARAHIAKAERTMAELEAWIAEQIAAARKVLKQINDNPDAVDGNRKDHEEKLRWAKKYEAPYLTDLRNLFANAETPEALVTLAYRTPEDREAWFKALFRSKDRIFSVYAAFELCSHFAACLELGKARTVIVTRLLVLCEKVWRHIVSPKLRNKFITRAGNAVLRVSMNIPIETKPVFAAIVALDKTAKFPKNTFGGVEIIKVQLDAQHGGRRMREANVHGENYEHQDIEFLEDESDVDDR